MNRLKANTVGFEAHIISKYRWETTRLRPRKCAEKNDEYERGEGGKKEKRKQRERRRKIE